MNLYHICILPVVHGKYLTMYDHVCNREKNIFVNVKELYFMTIYHICKHGEHVFERQEKKNRNYTYNHWTSIKLLKQQHNVYLVYEYVRSYFYATMFKNKSLSYEMRI